MNEDPTIPIGDLATAAAGVRVDVPAPAAAWGGFNLLARVGHGGFGEVYRAWDPHLQREVALKLLLPGTVAGEAEYEAMLREARALASVRHPNIVPVYGIDRHDGRVGFWTDFVRGKTLSVLVREQGTFGAREAALIGLDVARALSAVHRAGLLHRDIKTENVMREEGGRILLMDFGLSALEQRQTNIAGTPNYMAPELFDRGKATVATDIYAMGVLLYFLVAGDYPVHLGGLAPSEAIEAFPKRKPLMDLRPDLPESLLRTVSTATDMDPAKRFQSAGQLANALAESLGTHAPVEISVTPEPPRTTKTPTKWIFAIVLAAALILVGSLLWYSRRGSTANGNSAFTSGATDDFQKAQYQLLHSYKESNVAEAVKGFEAILKAEPENALALAELAAAHFIQYNNSHDTVLLEKAKDESNRAKSLDKNLAAPYITLSRIAASQGNTDMAMQLANTALAKDKRSAEAHGALGEVYEAQGKAPEAIEEYRTASDLAPDDWRWPVSWGITEFRQGNVNSSIKQLQNGIKLADDNAVAYYDLSIAHMQSDKIEEARKDLDQSIRYDPSSRAFAALGSALLLEGKFDDSVAKAKMAINLNQSNRGAWENLAVAYQWSGRRQQAGEAFHKAIELEEIEYASHPRDPLLAITLADDYASVGESTKSRVLARQALALAPENPTVHYRAGETFEELGEREKAIPMIVHALVNGYRNSEFERNPLLAPLRSDPRFTAALHEAMSKKKVDAHANVL